MEEDRDKEKNLLYRFRSANRFLNEIEEGEIYFSDLEKLNDPNEGIKNIFWEGDEDDWKKLLTHYFFCFWKFSLKRLEYFDSDAEYDINDDFDVNFSVDEYINSDKSLEELRDIILRDINVQESIRLISNKKIDKTILQSFLFYFYGYINLKLKIIDRFPKSKKHPNFEENEEKYTKDKYYIPELTENFYINTIRGILEEKPEEKNKLIINPFVAGSLYEEYSKSIKERYKKDFNCNYVELSNKCIDKIKNIPSTKFKVLCLSKNYNEILMWSHYAEGFEGVCLIFDSEKLKNDLKSIVSTAEFSSHNIEYVDTNSSKNWFDIKKEPIDYSKNNAYYNSLTKKMKNWDYEEEHRIIGTNLESNVLKYDYNALTGVIFGAKMSYKNKVKIIERLEKIGKNYGNTEFWESELVEPNNSNDSKINRTKVNRYIICDKILRIIMKKESKESNYIALKPLIESGKLNQEEFNNFTNSLKLPHVIDINKILNHKPKINPIINRKPKL